MRSLTEPAVPAVLRRMLAEASANHEAFLPERRELAERRLHLHATEFAGATHRTADRPDHHDLITSDPQFASVAIDGRVEVSPHLGDGS